MIAAANNTPYGLAAYVFTNDLTVATRMAEGLEAGIIGINDPVPATPQCPFGGMKESGLGRELGIEGLTTLHGDQVRLGRAAASLKPWGGRVVSLAVSPEKTLMTAEEFLALPDDGNDRWLIRGELRPRETEMTMRNQVHSEVEASVVFHLMLWWREPI